MTSSHHNTKLEANWTKQEDDKLIDYINAHGTDKGCWNTIPKAAGLQRSGKSCRDRWMTKLRPEMRRPHFCADEEELIIRLHALLGNRWSLIAGRLPDRGENEVKEYWNSHIKGKLESLGIDPNNHKVTQIIPRHTKNINGISINSESSCKQYLAADHYKEEEVSSSDLNLDLTIAFHPSSPNFKAVKKERRPRRASDHELKVDIIEADQDLEKHALNLFR